ncbi:MAG: pyridoxamine 5'-phosphate oxidase family protein [Desulfobacteraceae bacterium]|jgi:nitroimidazol reductase NimA-like FMN-containing flavoprotein (pyridoxamine 5'-phosphate oxidase superfamily)|nr:pyridoxamine 5'-phosphate oxidase family protein [Desulfobacteraceae bacterium]
MKVPMLKKNLEITDPDELEQILKSGQIITVAMCHGDQPYVLPFNYGFLNGAIYIHSARKGFKLKVLARNPRVSFNVIKDIQLLPADHPEDCSVAYSSVVGFGRVRMVDDPAEKLAALEAIMVQYFPKNDAWQYPDKAVGACTVWCIEIEHLTGKYERPAQKK